MDRQQRLGRPPTEVLTLAARRFHGVWQLTINSRPVGEADWDRLTLADLSTADLWEAVVTELQRRTA